MQMYADCQQSHDVMVHKKIENSNIQITIVQSLQN